MSEQKITLKFIGTTWERVVTDRFIGEPFLEGNGVAGYRIVRIRLVNDRPYNEYPPSTHENEEIRRLAVLDMWERRANGFFGTPNPKDWYPMRLDLAERIVW